VNPSTRAADGAELIMRFLARLVIVGIFLDAEFLRQDAVDVARSVQHARSQPHPLRAGRTRDTF
jgi:hypothetical protein